MRIMKTCMLTTVACWALCLAQPGFAGERPFVGKAEGLITFSSPTTAVVDYTGHATHLGKFTRQEFLTIEGPFLSGTIIYTAANGDELWVEFIGMFVSPNDAEGVYFIDGGTGRFADATGVAAFQASTPDFVNVAVTFEGTIDY